MNATRPLPDTARARRQEAQNAALYHLAGWADGYFQVGRGGRLLAHPSCRPEAVVDLYELALKLEDIGYPPPVLVRFTNILEHRLRRLDAAFEAARKRHAYTGSYHAVYPLKVNQQHSVVAGILRHGSAHTGLEAGSKAELMQLLALAVPGQPLICNGYKDQDYLRLVCAGLSMGLELYLVADKLSELQPTLEAAAEAGVHPSLGLRVRLASIASGNWQNTGGGKSKFGLTPGQVLEALRQLRAAGRLQDLRLLHFHIGSQVTDVRYFQRALREGACYYAELRAAGAPIDTVDVGGGLGIDYEGNRSTDPCSMNYSMEEYAEVVIQALAQGCAQHQLPQPRVITECGRAMTAHHAMLITNVINTERAPEHVPERAPPAEGAPHAQALLELERLRAGLSRENAAATCSEAESFCDEAQELFNHGLLGLNGLARAAALYHELCRAALPLLPEDAKAAPDLRRRLADKYLCNFSVFQTIPDAWALRQSFPVVPLHRLDEAPERRAVLHDLTCDSDGRLDQYVTGAGVAAQLPLHAPRAGEAYLLGIFLLGAYQEILGDQHNLFGDTASVNVELQSNGSYRINELRDGDLAADLLRYIGLPAETILERCASKLDAAGAATAAKTRCMELLRRNLRAQTYLGTRRRVSP